MTIDEIKNRLHTDDYSFLHSRPLGDNIFLLTLGGSHAYGLSTPDSDLDIRGVALNSKKEILLKKDFEQVCDTATDTVIYSFNKCIQLLKSNNPNTIEILGCKPEHYLYSSDIGDMLIKNQKMFLSKICIHSFAGYATAQLRRLENKSSRLLSQTEHENNILKSILNAKYDFKNRYFTCDDDSISLYIDKAVQKNFDSEIFMNIRLSNYPLRDWCGMWNEMKSIVNNYALLGKRNENAISHNKLGKHMAHLLRLYMMCIDILEKEKVITYRDSEHDLLMSIRNGEYLDDNRQPVSSFYDILNEYEKRFEYAKNNTSLPEKPDNERIDEFVMSVNEKIVRDGVL